MRRYEPKTRYKVSESQVRLLVVLLKYRFVSTDIVAEELDRDRSTIYERLNVLVDQEYVVKVYDKTHRLRLRPSIYYLAPKGIRYLKKAGYDRTNLHYKNKNFTAEQVDEQLLLYQLAKAAQRPYGKTFRLCTKYQYGKEMFYLSPPPYARLVAKKETTPDYFIEYIPPLYPSWKIKKRINQHVEYADDNDQYQYPHLLLTCGNTSTEKRAIRMTSESYLPFELFTTTQDRLIQKGKQVWLNPDEVDWDDDAEYLSLPLEFGT